MFRVRSETIRCISHTVVSCAAVTPSAPNWEHERIYPGRVWLQRFGPIAIVIVMIGSPHGRRDCGYGNQAHDISAEILRTGKGLADRMSPAITAGGVGYRRPSRLLTEPWTDTPFREVPRHSGHRICNSPSAQPIDTNPGETSTPCPLPEAQRKNSAAQTHRGNRHDTKICRHRLCAFAYVCRFFNNNPHRVGADPVRPSTASGRSSHAGASAALGPSATTSGHWPGFSVRGHSRPAAGQVSGRRCVRQRRQLLVRRHRQRMGVLPDA